MTLKPLRAPHARQWRIAVKPLAFLSICLIAALSLVTLRSPAHADSINTTDFVTTWKTDNPGDSCGSCITIPTTGGGYNYDVDWNNDGTFDELGLTGNITHDFTTPGEYTVRIRGTFPQIYMYGADEEKILDVKQWGSIQWRSMYRAFFDAENLQISAIDTPDLTNVTNMSRMFYNADTFNSDLSGWDTSNVTNMSYMFYDTATFSGDISTWDTSSVTSMESMFHWATAFNSDLSAWDTSNVTTMRDMFHNAYAFNSDLSGWDTSNVTNMLQIFRFATAFNGDISTWDTSNITDMSGMLESARAFNQDISSWDTSNVTDMGNMFSFANSFNQDLTDWDTSNVTDMSSMFSSADAFNGNTSGWDTSNVTTMSSMFNGTAFNQDISSWDTSNVTDMRYMFRGTPFNQDISSWDTSNVTDMSSMFYGATTFNQNLGQLNMSNVTNATNMLLGAGLSTHNYDATLKGFSEQNLQPSVSFRSNSAYCFAGEARQTIIDTFGWTITDGGLDCGLRINGENTVQVASGTPSGTTLGTLTAADIALRSDNPYELTCGSSGLDDGIFTIQGDSLITTATIDYLAPIDSNQDNTYSVCIKITSEDGDTVEQPLTISVRAPKLITSIEFADENEKRILIVNGMNLLSVYGSDVGNVTTDSFVRLNGADLGFCAEGLGMTAAEIVDAIGMTDPTLVSDNPPCYIYTVDGMTADITNERVRVWLPDTFDTTAPGTVSVNNSNTYTFNPVAEEPTEPSEPANPDTPTDPDTKPSTPLTPISLPKPPTSNLSYQPNNPQENKDTKTFTPTIYVNGDKPLSKTPTIPATPTFSGIASPGATVEVAIAEDTTCTATADDSGNWHCILPNSLEPGTYTINTKVTNPDGTIIHLEAYEAEVLGVETSQTPQNDPMQLLQQRGEGENKNLILVGGGLILVIIGTCIFILRQRKKSAH